MYTQYTSILWEAYFGRPNGRKHLYTPDLSEMPGAKHNQKPPSKKEKKQSKTQGKIVRENTANGVQCKEEKNLVEDMEKNNLQTTPEFIEGIDDLDESMRDQLPSQDHCTWFLNIIRIHAKKVAVNLLDEHKKTQVYELNQQVSDLKKRLDEIEEEVGILKANNLKQQSFIERLEFTNAKKQSEIDALMIKMDEFEQEKHEPCMQIVGLSESKDEKDDIKELTKIVEEKAGFKIKAGDILKMKRLDKKSDLNRRCVIVKFKNKEIKQQISEEKKKLVKLGDSRLIP